MKREELLKVLRTEEVQEEIKDLYCKLDRERYEEGGMSGWRWSIIVDTDRKVDYMYNSNCSSRMDVYEGNAVVVATLDSFIEVSTDEMGEVEDVEDIE